MTSLAKPDNLDEVKAKHNCLIKKGKELRRGCLEQALDLFQRAYEIFESEKLLRKFEKVKVKITFAIQLSMLSHCVHLVHPIKSETVDNSPNK